MGYCLDQYEGSALGCAVDQEAGGRTSYAPSVPGGDGPGYRTDPNSTVTLGIQQLLRVFLEGATAISKFQYNLRPKCLAHICDMTKTDRRAKRRVGVHKQGETRAHTPPPAWTGDGLAKCPSPGHAPQIRYSKRAGHWEGLTGCVPSPGPRPSTSLMLGGGAQRKKGCEPQRKKGCEHQSRQERRRVCRPGRKS